MVRKINPTPTLSGIDAELFIERLNFPSTPEEIELLKELMKNLNELNIFVN